MEQLQLRAEWAGFDLVKVGASMPVVYRRGDLVLISGCITTVSPTKNQAGWDLTIGWVDPRCCSQREVSFLAPTAMSRYEGIYQNATSVCLKPDGKLTINFSKHTNPMVLHFWGLAFLTPAPSVEPTLIPMARYESREWMSQSTRSRTDVGDVWGEGAFEADENWPLAAYRYGSIVFLQGELLDANYGPVAQIIAILPKDIRPRREIRCLACLLSKEADGTGAIVEQTVAVTLRPDGSISVQGGKVQQVDNKGMMRLQPQKKRGRLSLDGLRFSLSDGLPVKPGPAIFGARAKMDGAVPGGVAGKAKMAYLLSDSEACNGICVKQGDVVVLEGHISWNLSKPPNPKQVLATLPPGHWPNRREVFFTRGGSDLEERRRVDVDQYGRIFSPEGVPDGRLELTGIMYVVALENSDIKPQDSDWDDLKLHYHRNDANVASNTTFDGHELLEQFVRRSNHHEWRFIEYDFTRHAGRKMLLPLGNANLQGHEKWDPMNLGSRNARIWREMQSPLLQKYGVTAFHTLLHLSDALFDRVTKEVHMREDDRRYLIEKRKNCQALWDRQRESGLGFSKLQTIATEIVDQMFEHWDFRAQLQGALANDFRPPATIEHLFPQKKNGQDWHIKKHILPADMKQFEEIRQFFHLYETTGANMTHCCLMGSQDVFSTTGKWHFPDAPDVQRQLFKNIAWLFPKGMYCFMVERQTNRFPFIEDLDIQCKTDWKGPQAVGADRYDPPDELIMNMPQRDEKGNVCGEPGEFMRRRAMAVHMIYPHLAHLEVNVYSASGYNKGKDMLKSSFHLVWTQLIVDPDRAPVIRHATLGVFASETKRAGSFLSHLQNRLLELHDSNNWELVFDNTTIHARNGLRMPYNDKGSSVVESEKDRKAVKAGLLSKNKAYKKRVREDRPSVAVGQLRFEFEKDPDTGDDVITSAQWVADKDTYSIWEWIHMGTCRRDPNDPPPLTAWQLGPDVLAMLPTKPGEAFYLEGEDDGEGGHWVTHKPFPLIRRYAGDTKGFHRAFSEALKDEQDTLQEEEHQHTVLQQIIGSWVSLDEKQAIWRSSGAGQCEAKVLDHLWGSRVIRRPSEVAFTRKSQKVIVDGPKAATEALLRALKQFTRPDDNAVMPIYDLNKISA